MSREGRERGGEECLGKEGQEPVLNSPRPHISLGGGGAGVEIYGMDTVWTFVTVCTVKIPELCFKRLCFTYNTCNTSF